MAAFPIDDLNAIVADVQSGVVLFGDMVKHVTAITSWFGVSIPFFSASGAGFKGSACPDQDCIAKCQAFAAEGKADPTKMHAAAIDPTVISAIMQLIMMLIQKWLAPKP